MKPTPKYSEKNTSKRMPNGNFDSWLFLEFKGVILQQIE